MTKDQHQIAQTTKNGTSDKSLETKGRVKRLQIPESDFEAPIIDPTKAGQRVKDGTLDESELEAKVKSIAEAVEKEPVKTKDEMTIEGLYKMIQELQSRGGVGGDIELHWASAMSGDNKMIEVPETTYAQLVRSMKKKPSSVWYKDIRFFSEGTMNAILDEEGLSVDYVRGASTRKKSTGRFKGRT